MYRNVSTRRFSCAAGIAVLLALAGHGSAAAPVEESVAADDQGQPRGAVSARPAAGGAQANDSRRLAELFYELQVLRQDVQQLRGTMEEQGHRLDRLARDQQEQYLDLDRRMQALRNGGVAAGTGPSGPGSADAQGPAVPSESPGPGFPSGRGTPASEREAYAAAFDLMKERQFEASAQAFSRLVENYPNGAYTPNSFYWLGELHLAQDQLEQARQSFAQVINLYPDHQKVADSLYKLGVVYHRLGDKERAREYLGRVRREHPQSSAAGLAQTYLAEL